MKLFLIVVSVAVLEETFLLSEGRVRRQIWPAPANPFWAPNGIGGPNFYDNGDSWMGPPRFDQPPKNDFSFSGGRNEWNQNGGRNELNQNGGRNEWSQSGEWNELNQGGGRNDWNQNGGRNDRNNKNQDGRTTTEDSGPITSTPRTVHTAPQGCECPMTQQFNPICGTDGNTYRNKGLLNCYRRCGTNVSEKRMGRC